MCFFSQLHIQIIINHILAENHSMPSLSKIEHFCYLLYYCMCVNIINCFIIFMIVNHIHYFIEIINLFIIFIVCHFISHNYCTKLKIFWNLEVFLVKIFIVIKFYLCYLYYQHDYFANYCFHLKLFQNQHFYFTFINATTNINNC